MTHKYCSHLLKLEQIIFYSSLDRHTAVAIAIVAHLVNVASEMSGWTDLSIYCRATIEFPFENVQIYCLRHWASSFYFHGNRRKPP